LCGIKYTVFGFWHCINIVIPEFYVLLFTLLEQ